MTRRSLIQAALALPVLSWLAPKSDAKEAVKSDIVSSNVFVLDKVLNGGFSRGKVTEISNCQCSKWYAPFGSTTPDDVEFFSGQYGTPYVHCWRAELQNIGPSEVYDHCMESLRLGKAVVFITSHATILTNSHPFRDHAMPDICLVCDDPHDSSLKNAAVYRRS